MCLHTTSPQVCLVVSTRLSNCQPVEPLPGPWVLMPMDKYCDCFDDKQKNINAHIVPLVKTEQKIYAFRELNIRLPILQRHRDICPEKGDEVEVKYKSHKTKPAQSTAATRI